MAASANKKVQVVRFDRATLAGFLQFPEGVAGDHVEVLTPEGSLLRVPLSETKVVCFVRDIEKDYRWAPNRAFTVRPKTAGLWIRMRFRDADCMEGIIGNNLMLVESNGFSAIPPDPTFQLQRVFVPREALVNVEVLGVIGSSARRRPAKAAEAQVKESQIKMFE